MSEPYEPHAYQKHAINFVLNNGAAALFLDPGLGKTSIILAAFKELQRQRLVRRMLVIAPLRPAWSVWPGEVEKWTDFKGLSIAVLHGPTKDEIMQRVNSGANEPDICVINPEGLPWLAESISKDFPFDMLVVDESTRFIKHANTERFKTLKPMLPKFRRRYILTGSPAPNGLLDLFGQIFILDGGASLGVYISHFRMHFFDPTGYGGNAWVPKEGAEEAIYAKLKPLVLRMSAKDYLDLPPYIPNTLLVDLPERAKKVYDQMESMLVAQMDDGDVVTAANVGAATGECRQIANGGAYTSSPAAAKKEWAVVHEAKLDAVEEILEELGGKPALVAYEFDHDLARLRARFGESTPYIGGGVTQARFREIEDEWNRGRIPILLAQPQSVAHGLNLQGTGAAVIWHSLTWDLENYEQLIRRVWRQGQKERVVVHHIVARGTIDEVIMKTAAAGGIKDRRQQALLEALKSHLKGRMTGLMDAPRAVVTPINGIAEDRTNIPRKADKRHYGSPPEGRFTSKCSEPTPVRFALPVPPSTPSPAASSLVRASDANYANGPRSTLARVRTAATLLLSFCVPAAAGVLVIVRFGEVIPYPLAFPLWAVTAVAARAALFPLLRPLDPKCQPPTAETVCRSLKTVLFVGPAMLGFLIQYFPDMFDWIPNEYGYAWTMVVLVSLGLAGCAALLEARLKLRRAA